MSFQYALGIDYSGAKTSESRSPTIQMYECSRGAESHPVSPPADSGSGKHWSRKLVAKELETRMDRGDVFVVGIDHGFSLPEAYFKRYALASWTDFLADFQKHWPTDHPNMTVEEVRHGTGKKRASPSLDLRLTETWSSSAKSVFQFDVQGSVAKSTHAGLPWLWKIKQRFQDKVHVWPFDGWQPDGKVPVFAEIFPSLFRQRFPREQRSADQQDAYSVATWLWDCHKRDILNRYFNPPLTKPQRQTADLEGWILGIT